MLDGLPPPDTDTAEPGHAGHRDRLRARFMTGGADAMPDYELLELLLFSAILRKDTKPLAKRLITRFGDFAAEGTSGVDPFLDDDLRVGHGLLVGGAVGHAAGKFRHFDDEGVVRLAPIDDEFVAH